MERAAEAEKATKSKVEYVPGVILKVTSKEPMSRKQLKVCGSWFCVSVRACSDGEYIHAVVCFSCCASLYRMQRLSQFHSWFLEAFFKVTQVSSIMCLHKLLRLPVLHFYNNYISFRTIPNLIMKPVPDLH